MLVIGIFSPSILANKDSATGLINLSTSVLVNLALGGKSGLSFTWLLASLQGAFICTGKWVGVPIADFIPGFVPPAISGLKKLGLNCPIPSNKKETFSFDKKTRHIQHTEVEKYHYHNNIWGPQTLPYRPSTISW